MLELKKAIWLTIDDDLGVMLECNPGALILKAKQLGRFHHRNFGELEEHHSVVNVQIEALFCQFSIFFVSEAVVEKTLSFIFRLLKDRFSHFQDFNSLRIYRLQLLKSHIFQSAGVSAIEDCSFVQKDLVGDFTFLSSPEFDHSTQELDT